MTRTYGDLVPTAAFGRPQLSYKTPTARIGHGLLYIRSVLLLFDEDVEVHPLKLFVKGNTLLLMLGQGIGRWVQLCTSHS